MTRIKTDAEPEPDSDNPVTFADIAGADEAKEELVELVEYLRDPSSFTRLGGKVPKGVLLYGPPGTGKTLLAKATAGEARVPFFFASGSSFEEMYVGVGAKRVRELFAAARKEAPCIVFIDEIDAMGAKRSPRDASYVKLAFFELLQALDGFRSSEGVIVIAATNKPDTLDDALVRPGRFDRHITVANPDVLGRRDILGVHAKNVPLAADVRLEIIARGTPGFSGADLANLVNSAAVKAAVDRKECVSMSHLEWAKDKILMGSERKSAALTPESKQLTAIHESGHAVVAMFTDAALPVHKATIVPRGSSLGMVSQLPDRDETSISRRQMLARLAVCMGGRVAEELVMGAENVTSGAQSDFAQATNLADMMVTKWGLSEKLGPRIYDRENESPETRALIEAEMKELLNAAYSEAKALLTERSVDLHNVAKALLDRETLSGEEVRLAAAGKLPPLPRIDAELPSSRDAVDVGADLVSTPNVSGNATIPCSPRLSTSSPTETG
jgi:ATP-dependent metalloprotease